MTPTCGARARSTGKPCRLYPCKNGRCFLHGGKSTGPRTEAGRRRCAKANTTHGRYTMEATGERKKLRGLIKQCDEFLEGLDV